MKMFELKGGEWTSQGSPGKHTVLINLDHISIVEPSTEFGGGTIEMIGTSSLFIRSATTWIRLMAAIDQAVDLSR
jgi:hypothetical protein